jgi:hypothetical protein
VDHCQLHRPAVQISIEPILDAIAIFVQGSDQIVGSSVPVFGRNDHRPRRVPRLLRQSGMNVEGGSQGVIKRSTVMDNAGRKWEHKFGTGWVPASKAGAQSGEPGQGMNPREAFERFPTGPLQSGLSSFVRGPVLLPSGSGGNGGSKALTLLATLDVECRNVDEFAQATAGRSSGTPTTRSSPAPPAWPTPPAPASSPSSATTEPASPMPDP